jgi:hypothetical protein
MDETYIPCEKCFNERRCYCFCCHCGEKRDSQIVIRCDKNDEGFDYCVDYNDKVCVNCKNEHDVRHGL